MIEPGIPSKRSNGASGAARGCLVHVAPRVEGAVVVNPLVGWLLCRCQSRHFRLPDNDGAQLRELDDKVGRGRPRGIQLIVRSVHHGCSNPLQVIIVLDAYASTSQWLFFVRGRVESIWHGDALECSFVRSRLEHGETGQNEAIMSASDTSSGLGLSKLTLWWGWKHRQEWSGRQTRRVRLRKASKLGELTCRG